MCENCKFCRDLNGCYCYCQKKCNRVRISTQQNCPKFCPKAESKGENETQVKGAV